MIDIASTIFLFIYVLLLGGTLQYYLKKKKRVMDVSSFIIATYFVYACLAVIVYLFYKDTRFTNLKLFPFLYLYSMLMIGLRPVTKFSKSDYCSIKAPAKNVFNALVYFYVFLTFLNLPRIIGNMQSGIQTLFLNFEGGDELYRQSQSSYIGNDMQISNVFAIFYNLLSNTCIFLFFYYSILPQKKKWVQIALAISILVRILDSLAHGQRSGPTIIAVTFIATYFLLKPFLEEKIKKILVKVMIFGSVIVLIPFVTLTNSRFQNRDTGSLGGVVSYMGQAPLVFDKYCLDAGGIRYGDRTCPEFKRLLGFQNVPTDENDRREKYPYLKVDAYWFYTYVGDFVLDFGPGWAFVIFLVFSSLFVSITNHKIRGELPFHKLLMVYFAVTVCAQGGMYLFTYDHMDNYQIITILLLYVLFAVTDPVKNKTDNHTIIASGKNETIKQ